MAPAFRRAERGRFGSRVIRAPLAAVGWRVHAGPGRKGSRAISTSHTIRVKDTPKPTPRRRALFLLPAPGVTPHVTGLTAAAPGRRLPRARRRKARSRAGACRMWSAAQDV